MDLGSAKLLLFKLTHMIAKAEQLEPVLILSLSVCLSISLSFSLSLSLSDLLTNFLTLWKCQCSQTVLQSHMASLPGLLISDRGQPTQCLVEWDCMRVWIKTRVEVLTFILPLYMDNVVVHSMYTNICCMVYVAHSRKTNYWSMIRSLMYESFQNLFSFVLLSWRYIVAFIKVLTIHQICHSWIHTLHRSPLPSFPHSWNSFNRSHFYHLHTPTGPTLQAEPVLPPVLWFCKGKKSDVFV
jgi:hypothetical protein